MLFRSVIHDEQISSGTVGLRTNEQIGAPVSLSWPKQKSIATIVFNYLWIIRDTRISEWKASPRVESTSCGNLASPTVEDEPHFTRHGKSEKPLPDAKPDTLARARRI